MSWRLGPLGEPRCLQAHSDATGAPPLPLYRANYGHWRKVETDVQGGFHVSKQKFEVPTATASPLVLKFLCPGEQKRQTLSNGAQSDHRTNRLVKAPPGVHVGAGGESRSDTQQIFVVTRLAQQP